MLYSYCPVSFLFGLQEVIKVSLDNICFSDVLMLAGYEIKDDQTRKKQQMVMMDGARAALTGN